ncbi:MAG: protein kinase, partial [Candidatus Woesearchaeota archaeon]
RKRNLLGNLKHTQTLASYLGELHQQGIVHGDVKPDNLMIVKAKPFLIDFGLSTDLGGSFDHLDPSSNHVFGTPAYLAPEVFIPERTETKITPKLDQYGLGIVLYEAATGKSPFKNMGLAQILEIKTKESEKYLDTARNLIPGCPSTVVDVIHRCTQVNPRQRYSSCGEVAEELKEIIKEIT